MNSDEVKEIEAEMSACRCMTPPFPGADFYSQFVGIDRTNGRFGKVSVETCRRCGAQWITYSVEDEAFSESGRWYRGLASPEMLMDLTPEGAVGTLESLPWHYCGGSFFRSTGRKRSGPGPILVDL